MNPYGVIVPTSLPSTSGWQLVDWLEPAGVSRPAAGGVAEVELGQLGGDDMWLVDHMVVECSSTSKTVLRLYANGQLLDGTDAGNFNVADWPAGLRIRPSTTLTARWSGASAGAVGRLTLQARLLRRS